MAGADELLDAFDDGLLTSRPAPRAEVHRDGLWHQVFHCLVVRTTDPATVLLQRRPATARSFAGLLDLTATGHLLSGEQPADGVRELAEETGLRATAADLVPLGRRLLVDDSGEGRNREIVNAFLLPLDDPLETFALDGLDIDGLIEITAADLLRILVDPAASATCRELGTDGVIRPVVCRVGDLVPATDGYWIVLVVMAERFVAGQSPLSI